MQATETMRAQRLADAYAAAARFADLNPGRRWAVARCGGWIGVWDSGHGRYYPAFGRDARTGQWVGPMPVELVIGGRPCVEPADWLER